MAGTSETRQNLAAGVIENMNGFVAAIHNEHVFLLRISRKSHPPRGAARIRQIRRAGLYPDVALKLAHLVEHLDAIALAVADIDQPIVSKRNAMHHPGENAPGPCPGFLVGSLSAPLPQELSGLVEYRHPPVAVAVRDVDIAVARVDGDSGRIEK